MSDLRTYRPTGVAAVFLVAFVILTSLAVVIARALPSQNRFTPGQTITIAALLGLVLLAAVLIGRSKVTVDAHGIIVVNAVRTHRVPWGDVVSVEMLEGAPWPSLFVTPDRRIILFAIQGSDKRHAADAVAWLRGQVQEHTA